MRDDRRMDPKWRRTGAPGRVKRRVAEFERATVQLSAAINDAAWSILEFDAAFTALITIAAASGTRLDT